MLDDDIHEGPEGEGGIDDGEYGEFNSQIEDILQARKEALENDTETPTQSPLESKLSAALAEEGKSLEELLADGFEIDADGSHQYWINKETREMFESDRTTSITDQVSAKYRERHEEATNALMEGNIVVQHYRIETNDQITEGYTFQMMDRQGNVHTFSLKKITSKEKTGADIDNDDDHEFEVVGGLFLEADDGSDDVEGEQKIAFFGGEVLAPAKKTITAERNTVLVTKTLERPKSTTAEVKKTVIKKSFASEIRSTTVTATMKETESTEKVASGTRIKTKEHLSDPVAFGEPRSVRGQVSPQQDPALAVTRMKDVEQKTTVVIPDLIGNPEMIVDSGSRGGMTAEALPMTSSVEFPQTSFELVGIDIDHGETEEEEQQQPQTVSWAKVFSVGERTEVVEEVYSNVIASRSVATTVASLAHVREAISDHSAVMDRSSPSPVSIENHQSDALLKDLETPPVIRTEVVGSWTSQDDEMVLGPDPEARGEEPTQEIMNEESNVGGQLEDDLILNEEFNADTMSIPEPPIHINHESEETAHQFTVEYSSMIQNAEFSSDEQSEIKETNKAQKIEATPVVLERTKDYQFITVENVSQNETIDVEIPPVETVIDDRSSAATIISGSPKPMNAPRDDEMAFLRPVRETSAVVEHAEFIEEKVTTVAEKIQFAEMKAKAEVKTDAMMTPETVAPSIPIQKPLPEVISQSIDESTKESGIEIVHHTIFSEESSRKEFILFAADDEQSPVTTNKNTASASRQYHLTVTSETAPSIQNSQGAPMDDPDDLPAIRIVEEEYEYVHV